MNDLNSLKKRSSGRVYFLDRLLEEFVLTSPLTLFLVSFLEVPAFLLANELCPLAFVRRLFRVVITRPSSSEMSSSSEPDSFSI